MTEYQQSRTLAEIKAKHPFPWKEQRYANLVRLVDATGAEVVLFEITALATIVSRSIAQQEAASAQQAKSQVNDESVPQGQPG